VILIDIYLKRALNLNLNKNNIRYLDESVFESFFRVDSTNKLSLLGNTLNCTDCRSYWLIDHKSTIGSHIEDAICHNKQSIWDYKWQSFSTISYIPIEEDLGLAQMVKYFLLLGILIEQWITFLTSVFLSIFKWFCSLLLTIKGVEYKATLSQISSKCFVISKNIHLLHFS